MKYLKQPAVFMPLSSYVLLTSTFLLVFSGVTWLPLSDDSSQAVVGLRLFTLIGLSVSIILFATLSKLKKHHKGPLDGVISSLLVLVGVLLLAISTPELLDNVVLHRSASFCVGVGFGFMLKSCGYYFQSLDPKQLLFLTALISGLSAVLYFIVESCPYLLGIMLVCCMSCVAALFFWKLSTRKSDDALLISSFFVSHKAPDTALPAERLVFQSAVALCVTLMTAILQQNYFCKMVSPTEILNTHVIALLCSIITLGTLIAILLKPIAHTISLRVVHALGLGITLVTGALFSISAFALGSFNEVAMGLSSFLMISAFMGYFILLVIGLFHCTSHTRNTVLLGISCFLSLFLGTFALNLIARSIWELYTTPTISLIIFLVAAAIFVVLAVVSTDHLTCFTGPGLFEEQSSTVKTSISRDWSHACQVLAEKNDLSPREAEVLLLLAQGYQNANISELLYISNNTVRTHVHKVYQKLGIHSKSELIAKLLENSSE